MHHDLWFRHAESARARGCDAEPSTPLGAGGKQIPALVSVGKTGWMFILDRVSGKPIFGVEERPVPRGAVPGEWYSPTQPFPVKPAKPLVRVDFNKERDMVRAEDVMSTSPSVRRSGIRAAASITRARSRHSASTRRRAYQRARFRFPGGTGGINWGGATRIDHPGLCA